MKIMRGITSLLIMLSVMNIVIASNCSGGAFSRIKIEDLSHLRTNRLEVFDTDSGRYIRSLNISDVNKFYDNCSYLIYPRAKAEQYLSSHSFIPLTNYFYAFAPQLILVLVVGGLLIGLGIYMSKRK